MWELMSPLLCGLKSILSIDFWGVLTDTAESVSR